MTGVIGGLAGVGGAASVAQSQPAGSKARACRALDASTVPLSRAVTHRSHPVCRNMRRSLSLNFGLWYHNKMPVVFAGLTDCVLRCSGRGSRQAPAKQPRRQCPARKRQHKRGGKQLVHACNNEPCSSSGSASSWCRTVLL